MAERTLQDLDLKALGLEEEEDENLLDPELDALLKRNPSLDLDGLGLSETETREPIPGAGLSRDVTEEVKSAGSQRDSLSYEGLYGEYPDYPLGAKVASVFEKAPDPESGVLTSNQKALAEYDEAVERFNTSSQEIYNNTGYQDGANRFYTKVVTEEDENGNTVNKEYIFKIPDPTSSAFGRSVEQAGKDIFQQVGGLVTEGKFTGESNLERNVADYQMQGGEQLFTDLLSIAAPVIPAIKGARYVGKLLKGGKEVGTKGTLAIDAGISSFVETVMSREGDTGLLITPSSLESSFLNEQQAKDVSMFLDGLFLNGAFDGIVAVGKNVIGPLYGKGKELASESTKLLNNNLLSRAAEDDTLKGILTYLDPKIFEVPANETKRRLYLLAEKLNNNSVIEVALGQSKADIKADTSVAMLRASEAYVREANQKLMDTMSKAEYDEFVEQEAARMSSAMIGLMRSQLSNPIVSSSVDKTATEVAGFINQSADQLARQGRNIDQNANTGAVDQAAQTLAKDVVGDVDTEMAGLRTRVGDVNRQTDELLSKQSRVVEQNPIIEDMLGSSTVFSTDPEKYRDVVQEIFTNDVYKTFKDTFDNVAATYDNLPDAPIDAALLKSKLNQVVAASNIMDESGRKAGDVLRAIIAPFDANVTKRIPDPLPIAGEEASIVVSRETPEQITNRIAEEINFKDLYDIKKNLSSVIDNYSGDPEVRKRLIEFRDHITDADSGQMAHVINTYPDVADQYRNADAVFKEAKAKFSNSQESRALEDKLGARRAFDPETNPRGEIPGPLDRNEVDAGTQGQVFSDQVVADTTGLLRTQLDFMLDGVRSPRELDGAFGDLFVANATQQLREAIAMSGDSPQTEAMVVNAFKGIRQKLSDLGDTATLAKLDEAVRQIEDARGNLGDMVLANETLKEQLEAQARQAQESILGKLISDEPGRPLGLDAQGPTALRPVSNARDVISSIMTGADSTNKIQTVLDRVALLEGNQKKQALEALQAVALDTVGSKLIGATPTSKGKKAIALGQVNKLSSDDASNLMKSIDLVFPADASENGLMKESVLQTLGVLYDASIPSRMKVAQAGSDTVVNNDIRDAVSTAILLTAGYMNPTAAMLRRLTAAPIAEKEKLQKEVAAHVLAIAVTDPKAFSKAIKQYADGSPEPRFKQAMSLAINSAVRTGRYEMRVIEQDEYGQEDVRFGMDRDMQQFGSRIFGGDG